MPLANDAAINELIQGAGGTTENLKELNAAIKDFRGSLEGVDWSQLNPQTPGKEKLNVIPAHGTTALLNTAGVDPNMHSTVVRPSNFAEALPLFPSEYDDQLFEVITGQTADSGTNPTDVCSTPATTGFLKVAQIKAIFGTIWKGTKTVNIVDQVTRKNRADVDRRLINFEGAPTSKFVPAAGNKNINTPIGKELIEFGNSLALGVSHVNIQGDVANTGASAYSGFTKEWNGIDKWVRNDYQDEVSAVLAPALNSLVAPWNGTLNANFYTHFANVLRTLKMDGRNMGFGEVPFMLLMHPYAMYPLVDVVSCNFNSTRCSTDGIQDGLALDIRARQIEMLTNMYVPVDNFRIPFVTDWGVPATYNAATNVWESDMYILPIASGMNGEALQYMEYQDMDITPVQEMLRLGAVNEFMTFNNGMFIGRRVSQHMCMSWEFAAKMRYILRTPWLAARIDNVQYTSNTPFRSPIIGDTYYKNGGQYLR